MDELNTILSYEAQSRTSVYRRYGEFIRGLSSQDEISKDRPKSIRVLKTIDFMRPIVRWRQLRIKVKLLDFE